MTINARRFAYDTDGTMIGYRLDDSYDLLATNWFTPAQLTAMNSLKSNTVMQVDKVSTIHVIFPNLRNITSLRIFNGTGQYAGTFYKLQYSVDTNDGEDGTWSNVIEGEVSVEEIPSPRDVSLPFNVTIPVAIKGLRIWYDYTFAPWGMPFYGLVIYGSKVTPDDLRFTDVAGTEFTALQDLGNKVAGSSTVSTVYVKNGNATYGATDVIVKVEGTRYTTSLDNVTFDATDKVIGALASGAISAPIYVKFAPIEGDALGFNAGRILVTGTIEEV